MARRKSRSKRKSKFTAAIWALLTAVSGGGIGGYFNPDWPVIGPLIERMHTRQVASADGDGDSILDALSDLRDGNQPPGIETPPMGSGVPATTASAQRPSDKLLIATFNIQVFGKSKMSKKKVVDVLAKTVRQFDVVAIQEVRAKDDDIIPRFIEAINADGSRYDFIIGPRLGRSVSTEQYVFVYDTTRVEYDPSSVGTMSDPADVLHREPYVARFRARTQPPEKGFSFFLINIHTDPDEVPQEISVLADVFQVMQTAREDEDDVILLGDLNASVKQFGRLGQVPGIRWCVDGDVMTNTRRNKQYDNILFHGEKTSEFTGRWGVLDLEQTYGLTRDEALKVSDHLPVWAEFSTTESGSAGIAERIGDFLR